MKLIFVFAIIFGKVSFIDLFEIVEIIRAFRIHTFMNDKVLPVFLLTKSMATMRAAQSDLFGKTVFLWRKVRVPSARYWGEFTATNKTRSTVA